VYPIGRKLSPAHTALSPYGQTATCSPCLPFNDLHPRKIHVITVFVLTLYFVYCSIISISIALFSCWLTVNKMVFIISEASRFGKHVILARRISRIRVSLRSRHTIGSVRYLSRHCSNVRLSPVRQLTAEGGQGRRRTVVLCLIPGRAPTQPQLSPAAIRRALITGAGEHEISLRSLLAMMMNDEKSSRDWLPRRAGCGLETLFIGGGGGCGGGARCPPAA